MKELTVVTICYNESGLEQTCNSIVSQSFQDFQWIVVDGGSKQSIQEIFEKYKSRIDIFISEPDNGVYSAYNKAIKLACGKYINFMNAGDSFYDNDVLYNFSIFDKAASDLIYGDTNKVYKDKTFVLSYPDVSSINELFFIKGCFNTQSTFFSTELFSKFGLFDEKFKICADYEKYCLYFKNNVKFKKINSIIANYSVGGMSSNPNNIDIIKNEKKQIIYNIFSKEDICKAKKQYLEKRRELQYEKSDNYRCNRTRW